MAIILAFGKLRQEGSVSSRVGWATQQHLVSKIIKNYNLLSALLVFKFQDFFGHGWLFLPKQDDGTVLRLLGLGSLCLVFTHESLALMQDNSELSKEQENRNPRFLRHSGLLLNVQTASLHLDFLSSLSMETRKTCICKI